MLEAVVFRWKVPQISSGGLQIAISAGFLLLALLTAPLWLPALRSLAAGESAADRHDADSVEENDSHRRRAQGVHEGDEAVILTDRGRRTIGLTTAAVQLTDFTRSLTIPAIVAVKPGRTKLVISAPLTGVVTDLRVVPGQDVRSGQTVARLRLTHEDLVQAQTAFLRTLGELDVEKGEIARLEEISPGVIAGKVILERKYEKEKLEAALNAERQSLLLHGLRREQIQRIERDRDVIREVDVPVPFLHHDQSLHGPGEEEHTHGMPDNMEEHVVVGRFLVDELQIRSGAAVLAGEPLCVLADYSELFLVGQAFEQDAEELVAAAASQRPVTGILRRESGPRVRIPDLRIAYVANEIDEQSRTLPFYVNLPNERMGGESGSQQTFAMWRFRPGQRMQVRIPVEEWEQSIVLPVEAVVREGAEAYVFLENGSEFIRRPVHLLYRDHESAVIAADGAIFPGQQVAVTATHQLQMALKQQSGEGGGDHHGHMH